MDDLDFAIESNTAPVCLFGCSKANQFLLVGMIIAAFAAASYDRIFLGRPETLTLIVTTLVLKQVLDTFVRYTRFTRQGVEHRTSFGRLIVAKYAELSVIESTGQITLIRENRQEIRGRQRDGNLSLAAEILGKKVSRYLKSR